MVASAGTIPAASPTGVCQGTGSLPQAMLTANPRDPELGSGEGGPDRARMEGRPSGVDAVVDAGHHEVRPGSEALDAGQDDGEGRGAVDPVGGDMGQSGDLHRFEGDRLPLVDRTHRGTGSAVIDQRGHHDQLVLVAQGRGQASGQGGDSRREDAVVVGDQDAHVRGSCRGMGTIAPGATPESAVRRAGCGPIAYHTGRCRPPPVGGVTDHPRRP